MEQKDLPKILITGISGFIGSNLCVYLKSKGYFVRGAVRGGSTDPTMADEYSKIGDINESTEWQQALNGIDVVIHLAARVHVIKDKTSDPLGAFRRVNVKGTERLAQMAAKAGVKRFIFISSIGVNGELTVNGSFNEKDVPNPVSPYAISKWEAEQVLLKVAKETGIEMVILRPSLVYGMNAPGNFDRLVNLVKKQIPIPLGRINNLRSFVYVGNLVDAISQCITHPRSVGETFLVSDGEDVSTAELMKMIAVAMKRKVCLFPLSPAILRMLASLAGQKETIEKLTGSLCIDSSKIRKVLNWNPPFTLQEGIKEMFKGNQC